MSLGNPKEISQLFDPHFKLPRHPASESQSPSPFPHKLDAVQQLFVPAAPASQPVTVRKKVDYVPICVTSTRDKLINMKM